MQKAACEYLQKLRKYRIDRVSIERNSSLRANFDIVGANDDLDWNAYVHMRQAIHALRNHYAAVHDVISKNWCLITQPLSDDSMPLMF